MCIYNQKFFTNLSNLYQESMNHYEHSIISNFSLLIVYHCTLFINTKLKGSDNKSHTYIKTISWVINSFANTSRTVMWMLINLEANSNSGHDNKEITQLHLIFLNWYYILYITWISVSHYGLCFYEYDFW